MDVVTVEDAKLAESSGACAVMALERVPSDIVRQGIGNSTFKNMRVFKSKYLLRWCGSHV